MNYNDKQTTATQDSTDNSDMTCQYTLRYVYSVATGVAGRGYVCLLFGSFLHEWRVLPPCVKFDFVRMKLKWYTNIGFC